MHARWNVEGKGNCTCGILAFFFKSKSDRTWKCQPPFFKFRSWVLGSITIISLLFQLHSTGTVIVYQSGTIPFEGFRCFNVYCILGTIGKSVFTSDRAMHCANHGWHMIILSMIGTTWRDWVPKWSVQNWGYYEADEYIQRQLSAMGRKQNVWENIAAKLNDKCKYQARGYLTKFNTGRLRPEVEPLTLLSTILAENLPLLYTFYWKKVPLSHTYFRKSCSA